jgi:lipid-binding SYLF domain-containing protein
VLVSALSATSAAAAISTSETARLAAAARIVQDIRPSIPESYWDRARCVGVIPDLKKAAFVVGGEYGKGVLSCRAGTGWSAPVFMQLAKGSWGFQVGAEQVDVVLLVMNESGVQKLLDNKVNLGADASVAAGPLGRQGAVGTDAALTAEILSYSRAQGLFAGIDLSGGVLRPDDDSNRDVYGDRATPRTVLAMHDISAPTQAAAFLDALGGRATALPAPRNPAPDAPRASTAPAAAAGSSASVPAPSPAPAGEADLRARAVELQQSIDRLIADAASAPVGTAGTTSAAADAVTVSRDRLAQLRRQIDALIAAIDKRP